MKPPLALSAALDLTAFDAVAAQVAAAGADFRPFFRGQLAPDVAKHLRAQYESRGAHLGTPWKPLALTTIRMRTRVVRVRGGGQATTSRPGRAKAGFATPMRDSLRSYFSLTRTADPEGIRDYAPNQMAWGTRLPYMAPHHTPGGFTSHLGGTPHHVPERPVIPAEWPQAIADSWAAWALSYVVGG